GKDAPPAGSNPTNGRYIITLEDFVAYSLGLAPFKAHHSCAAAGLVSDQREGQWVYYRRHSDLRPWQLKVPALTQEGLGSDITYGEDLSRLRHSEAQRLAGDCRKLRTMANKITFTCRDKSPPPTAPEVAHKVRAATASRENL